MAQGEKHVPALDGVRGLAILLVLVYHQTILTPACRIDQVFGRIARAGWCGVDLFFVLSGFLITGILLDSKGEPRYFRNFYARRVLRIFPLYYALLAFTFFILPKFFVSPSCDPAAFVGRKTFYWLYLGNYVMAAQGGFWHEILAVTWSLSIEEQFYLLWPVVVLLLNRRALLRGCVAIFSLTLLLRASCVLGGLGPVPVYVLTPLRLDGLAAGAFLAVVLRGSLPEAVRRTAWRVAALSGGLSALIWALPGNEEWYGIVTQEFGYSTLALFFGALVLVCIRSEPESAVTRVFSAPALRFLGKYSYAIYLFHFPLKSWVRYGLWGREPLPVVLGSRLPAQLLFYAAASSLTVALAWLSWHLYEKHFLRLKRFFSTPGRVRPAGPLSLTPAKDGPAPT